MVVIENWPLILAENKNRVPEILLGQWAQTAWNGIFSESLVKGFKIFYASNSLKGTHVDFLSYKNNEENPSSSDKGGGNDYLGMCL
jgi:hypothetical protein